MTIEHPSEESEVDQRAAAAARETAHKLNVEIYHLQPGPATVATVSEKLMHRLGKEAVIAEILPMRPRG